MRQLQYADADWRPIIPVWGEINNLMDVALSKAISRDKPLQATLDNLKAPIDKIMTKGGYRTGAK